MLRAKLSCGGAESGSRFQALDSAKHHFKESGKTGPFAFESNDEDSMNCRGILLDIEGTTSSISFVHDVMFPFVLARLDDFLQTHLSGGKAPEDAKVISALDQIAIDAGHASLASWKAASGKDAIELVANEVRQRMSVDAKSTGLKALQGLIWHGGFTSGELKAHIYPDVIPAIKQWIALGKDVRIYSSGSIAAQKLFFGHLEGEGDCLHLISGHYDTTIGGKKESASYTRVADDWGLPAEEILFISDIAEELSAAKAAGLNTLASVRPGNSPLPDGFEIAGIRSFAEVIAGD